MSAVHMHAHGYGTFHWSTGNLSVATSPKKLILSLAAITIQ